MLVRLGGAGGGWNANGTPALTTADTRLLNVLNELSHRRKQSTKAEDVAHVGTDLVGRTETQ